MFLISGRIAIDLPYGSAAMTEPNHINNYDLIARSVEYATDNAAAQPTLDDIAATAGLPSLHLNRLFTDWVGVGVEKALHYASTLYIRKTLQGAAKTPLFASGDSDSLLCGEKTARTLSVDMERINVDTAKVHADRHCIHYGYWQSLFGNMLIASTQKGICYAGFRDDKQAVFADLKRRLPAADLIEKKEAMQGDALRACTTPQHTTDRIKLHIHGTDFQLKVWRMLLTIPMGQFTTYGALAAAIQQPGAARAVGTAVGRNPVAFLIPCHRVVRVTGAVGGYLWGATRKRVMIAWEAARSNTANADAHGSI